MNPACIKINRGFTMGTCTLKSENQAITICPNRFLENGQLFADAAREVFGRGSRIAAVPEVSVFSGGANEFGKVDFMVLKLDDSGTPTDQFFALEIQSVYVSGKSSVPVLRKFLTLGAIPRAAVSAPDYRSSHKRLIPQLESKMPIFRAWGIKYLVAVDHSFLASLPDFPKQNSLENSEITWLAYPFPERRGTVGFEMGMPRVVYSTYNSVHNALTLRPWPAKNAILQICREKLEKEDSPRNIVRNMLVE